MKTIIAVWNRAGVGKTESIRQFAMLLLQVYPHHIVIKPPSSSIEGPGDFEIVIDISSTRIGIVSQGDPGTGMVAKVKNLIKLGCEFIICSTRTRGSDVNTLITTARKSDYTIVWTSTYETDLPIHRIVVNKIKGKHILDIVQSLKFSF